MTSRRSEATSSEGFLFRIRNGLLWMCAVEAVLASLYVATFWNDLNDRRVSIWILFLGATIALRALAIRKHARSSPTSPWAPSTFVLATVWAGGLLWASSCLLIQPGSTSIAQVTTSLAATAVACAACGFVPGGVAVTVAYLIPAVLGAFATIALGIPLSAQVAMLSLVFLAVAWLVQFWTTRLISSSTSLSEQLLQAQRTAEKASAIKSAIIANTSHELRTPLNAVIGFSEAISQQILGPIGNPKYLDYAQSIQDSGRHLLQIINDILDISRIESGKYEMHEGSVPIDEIAEFSIRMVRDAAGKAGVTISTAIPEPSPRLLADERMLKQIVLNLLSNAVKFTPVGGTVTLSADYLGTDEYCIAIQDSGIGIPAEDLERVFEPFVQIEGAFNRRHQGTGLGLALVRAMAEQHHARLELQSEIGRGTIARVCFPASRVIHPQASHQDLARAG